MNLGEPINSTEGESCPYVTSDGKLLIFTSTRMIQEYETQPLQPIDSFKDKSESFDDGALNIFYTSTTFIERLRARIIEEN